MITAILKAGILTGKMRLIEPIPEVDILLPIPLFTVTGDFLNEKIKTTPRMTFIWKRQIKQYTHEYVLKEVL